MTLNSTRRAFAAGALATPLFATVKAEPATAPARTLKVRQSAAAFRESAGIPAVAAALGDARTVGFDEAFGMADLEARTPATPASRFRVGSVSKIITATAGARLLQAGVIDLDAPISTWLPDLPAPHRATTLRQLFTHRGGVRHYVPRDFDSRAPGGPIDLRTYRSTGDTLAIFINDPLVAPVGTSVNYSTFGFTLISAVMEKAAKAPFLDIVRKEVAEPLKLTTLTGDLNLSLIPGRVRPYQAQPSGSGPGVPGPIGNAPPVNPAYKWAGGGFMSSAGDLCRLAQAMLQPGYLKPETLKLVFTPMTTAQNGSPPLGLAWRIDKSPKLGARWHHAGSIEGGRAQIAIYPEAGLVGALLSNLSQTPADPLTPLEGLLEAYRA